MPLPISRAGFARAAPFLLFMVLLGLRGALRSAHVSGIDVRWVYAVSVALVGAVLIGFRRDYVELSRAHWLTAAELALAATTGLAVFVLWIHLDAPWMTLGAPAATFVPVDAQGRLDVPLIAVRWIGAALPVPVMEELFWRSLLMRWLHDGPFTAVDPRRVGLRAMALSTLAFMLAHMLWLAAIVAGLAYAWLYRRTGKLWTAVIAHAVTNGALGAWVVATRSWAFW